jgi:outer membrane protein assembly factor BamB
MLASVFLSSGGTRVPGTNTRPFDDDIISPRWKRSGTVYAIDVQSRSVAWKRHSDNGSIKWVHTYHRGRLFVPLFNNPQGNRLALHWRDGHTLWEKAIFGDDGWATSAVDDRYLYSASHGQGAFVVQDQETGDVVWQIEAGPGICCSPIISGGVMVAGTTTDFLAVRVGPGKLVDATWRGNSYFTGYTPQAVEFPEEEKVPRAESSLFDGV